MYHAKMTPEEIRANLDEQIRESEAELKALKAVKIDTKHKTLTNRAISGEGARIGDYLGINKALYVSYKVTRKDGGTKYMNRDIAAYSYEDENGQEIGSNGGLRISRTLTPGELNDLVQKVIAGIAENVKKLKSDYRRADMIAKKRNALIDQIDTFNASVSYETKTRI